MNPMTTNRWLTFSSAALLTGALLLLISSSASAKGTKVKATGVAAIYRGDTAAARDKAIQDAQRKAVEQAVGTLVSSQTVTENFQLLSDKIYSRAKGYVRSYRVLSTKTEDGAVQVEIEAEVSSGNLKNDLDGILAVLQAKNLPRVLVMVTEQNVGSVSGQGWWQQAGGPVNKVSKVDLGAAENAIVDALGQKGFPMVDRQALQGKISVGKALTTEEPSDADIKEFAAGTGAEVVIVGKAIANDIGPIMGTKMHSLRGNISLRALALDNGRILATSTQTGTVGHIDPTTGGTSVLGKVARKASDDLLQKILKQWETEVAGASTVHLTIKNVQKSKHRRLISGFIANEIRGVQDVRQRGFRNKVAEFEVELTGNADNLAEELEEKQFDGFKLEINEITATTVTATIN